MIAGEILEVSMHYALHVPNFGDPGELVDLGVATESAGWDGFFVWDHVFGGPGFPVPMADPWVVLGALAVRTERMRIGTAITPMARRRPQKVEREIVTLDHLSGGRAVLGVGLGNPLADEYGAFGEPDEPRIVADRLDEALDVLNGLSSAQPFDHDGTLFTVRGAQFLPAPVQVPRVPVWVAAGVPHRRPLARAAKWDGVILAAHGVDGRVGDLTPDQVRDAIEEIHTRRGDLRGFDVAVLSEGLADDRVVETYAELGVTWVLATGWVDELPGLIHARRSMTNA